MTDVAFRKLTAAEQIFYDLVWQPCVTAGLTYLRGSIPFFSLPIISPITTAIVTLISQWLFGTIVLAADVTAIKLVNAEHEAAYEKASIVLKIICHDKGIESDEYKFAKENAKIALARFVSYGAAS